MRNQQTLKTYMLDKCRLTPIWFYIAQSPFLQRHEGVTSVDPNPVAADINAVGFSMGVRPSPLRQRNTILITVSGRAIHFCSLDVDSVIMPLQLIKAILLLNISLPEATLHMTIPKEASLD